MGEEIEGKADIKTKINNINQQIEIRIKDISFKEKVKTPLKQALENPVFFIIKKGFKRKKKREIIRILYGEMEIEKSLIEVKYKNKIRSPPKYTIKII